MIIMRMVIIKRQRTTAAIMITEKINDNNRNNVENDNNDASGEGDDENDEDINYKDANTGYILE